MARDESTLGPFELPGDRKKPATTPPYVKDANDMPPGESPPSPGAAPGVVVAEARSPEEISQLRREAELIQKAREIYTTSTDYLNTNITNTWEKNLAHFNNEHSSSSKFRTRNYKRSNVFRPKTRAVTKGQEAALAVALFATEDKAVVTPENPSEEAQQVSARINKDILQYRLTKRMPWFLTAIGAYQSTKVYGICISHQYWRYDASTEIKAEFNEDGSVVLDEDGATPMGREHTTVRKDELVCDLIAPENFRFDPMADWRDPVNTSPYLIYMMPIHASEALENMNREDSKTGLPVWKKYELSQILATRRNTWDRTRQAREGNARVDPSQPTTGNAFTTVWAHFNIIRENGEDMGFWTMGTELLLTEPEPLAKMYPHLARGERPFTVGYSTVEAFRNYPAGDVEQISGLQEETNTIANSRLDNVKLVLNKRYYIRRGGQVDLGALVRNIPGGGVMMGDTEKDVKTVDTPDVTQSSYVEQDRLAVEMDDLVGTFSPSSAAANKPLAKSVGGADQMSQQAGAVQDYGIQIYIETWVEPTLRQLVKLIQMYETDDVVLVHAADAAQIWQKYGLSEITDRLLQQDLAVSVDVGIGNTDPVRRVERLIYGVNQAVNIPGMAERVKGPKITDEIFATIGYRDGSRFFMTDKEFEEFRQANPPQPDPEITMKQLELQIRREDNKMRDSRERDKNEAEQALRAEDMGMRRGIANDIADLKLLTAGEQNETTRQIAAASTAQKSRDANLRAVPTPSKGSSSGK